MHCQKTEKGEQMSRYHQTELSTYIPVTHIIELLYRGFPSDYYVGSGNAENFWRLYYVDRGHIVFYLTSEDSITLTFGHGIFIAPNTKFHHMETTTDNANMFSVFFRCPQLNKERFNKKLYSFSPTERTILSSLVTISQKQCERYSNNPKASKGTTFHANIPDYLPHLVKVSLEYLLLLLYQRKDNSSKVSKPSTHYDNWLVNSAIEFMYQCLDKKLTVQEIASHVGMSASNFHAVFKKATNQSVIDYFNTLKVEQAKILIRQKRYTHSEIATILGYSSESYFSRHFKKKVGMTPTEYALLVYHG